MATTMEQSHFGSRRHDEPEFDLKEWGLKARISHEKTSSRRYSASYIRSFREEASSVRSNFAISSTASSPGYTLREEIDPSTYSFNTALKALQAKTVYTWEYLSPDGLALNSKWSDAEKYICNPLSGQVPLECLSAKTLSGRYFHSLTSRITMSAPLVYPSHLQQLNARSPIAEHKNETKITIQDHKQRSTTRDVGTQSTPPELSSSSSPSPAVTPSIEERAIRRSEGVDSPISYEKSKVDNKVVVQVEEREARKSEGERKKERRMNRCSQQGGCLSLRSLWMRRRQSQKHKPAEKTTILCHITGC